MTQDPVETDAPGTDTPVEETEAPGLMLLKPMFLEPILLLKKLKLLEPMLLEPMLLEPMLLEPMLLELTLPLKALNADEELQLAAATFEFFNDTFQEAFPETFVTFAGEPTSSEFLLDAIPTQYRLSFTGQSVFFPCAPPLEEFQSVLDNADYVALWNEYVRPDAAVPGNLLVFVERAEYTGVISYL
ncbi:expressed unknown protein [Seminavis robusta]|uniref:Uncharacterized protein n=1 Tax=Seminavis robusta TaxID=568900 RepID=A0A9N8EFB2_9STRA|nr:expressed unknown protein [Seminavis robusta]|eukprot:Sro1069_g237580.1 n/a (187) ;mRNA; r:16497-17233